MKENYRDNYRDSVFGKSPKDSKPTDEVEDRKRPLAKKKVLYNKHYKKPNN
jgi:hypothetical protein